jgi:glycerophosphoryl diester phosphodiesterase
VPLEEKAFMDTKRPLNIAHRGGMALWPENTLHAFEGAVKLGADVLEIDVRPTLDGVIVVIHDHTVDRTSNGKGPVEEMTIAELKKLDFAWNFTTEEGHAPLRGRGITICTLEELFARLPETNVNIDIKKESTEFADQVIALIRNMEMKDKVVVASFHDSVVKHVQQTAPEIDTAASTSEAKWLFFLHKIGLGRLHKPVAKAYQVPIIWNGFTVVTRYYIHAANLLGQEVHVWNINDPDEMRGLISIGVDGIVTDRPDILAKVIEEIEG